MDWQALWQAIWQAEGASLLVTQLFVIITATLLAAFVQRRLLRRIMARAEKTRSPWDDALVFAFQRTLSLLIWVLGISFAAEIAGSRTDTAIFRLVEPLRAIGVIAAVAWFAMRFIKAAEEGLLARAAAEEREVDRTTANALAKLLRVSVMITAALMAMQTLGFSISGILAFGGVGGIAVGFAAKDLLANFFGGLMIYLDRPFAVGDWVRSPDRSIEGTVEEIGWRLCRIRTFDKRPLYVPNSMFNNIVVENPSRMSHRRIHETIGIRYEDADKMGGIVAAVRTMLEHHPEIDSSQTLIVNFNSFAPSSLDFFIYTFTHTTEWVKFHGVKQDVLLKVLGIIDEHGAQVAYPTSTVHIPEQIALRGEADRG